MIETIEVVIDNKKCKYSKGISLEEILGEHSDKYEKPILIAKVDNRLRELSAKVENNAKIEFLDLTSNEGNRCHINGLILVLLYATNTLYGKKSHIKVLHSLDKGLYIKTSFKIDELKVNTIKKVMKEIIKKDMPISRLNIDRLEAKKYYQDLGEESKSGILNYSTDNYITLYRLGNVYDYFYSLMPISTNRVKDFDLTYIDENSFVLRFPTVYISDRIKKYEDHPNMFEVFREYKNWAELIGVSNALELNRVVSTGKISDLIKIDETLQSNKLLNVAKDINNKKNKVKIILMAGPSSSGKTTTSRKLCMYLKSFGLNPIAISMDDYFVERDQTPKDKNGEYDYECLEAVDLKLFDKQIAQLLEGKKIKVPTFNFIVGKKEYAKEIQVEENDILIIEGIHALDTKILTNIKRENKYKIYISPLTELNLDSHNRIPTTDNRLLRRIVRDNRTRNYRVDDTLQNWPKVRSGEEKYIFPYQDEGDVTINSAAIYEIGVLKTYVEPLLYSVDSKSPYYEEAKRLINFLRMFLPIPSESIPEDAVIREFIGGSYFHE